VQATDVLSFGMGDIGSLDRPVMLVGLEGWFDVGGAATQAVNAFTSAEHAVVVGSIDPDPFYDFTQQRPHTMMVDEAREIVWPSNTFVLQRSAEHRDVVGLVGVEPHLNWKTYVDATITVATALGCEAVVTVGSAAEALPHTRTPPVTGSTSTSELASRLGLAAPSYQGITGIAGVLNAELEARGIPSISLRVGIPHYLMNAEHPMAVAALVRHLSHVLDVPTTVDVAGQIDNWSEVHDQAIAEDDQLRMYVRMLESEFDRRAEAAIPTADDLGDQFEEFLREQRDD
jgi:proteasome assembly chaperone (PAC2) family protein